LIAQTHIEKALQIIKEGKLFDDQALAKRKGNIPFISAACSLLRTKKF